MTAPQHDAEPPSKQGNNPSISRRQNLQRCWFVGMGLLGGFGFVTSQMSFALAETDFLTADSSEFPAEESSKDESYENSYVAGSYSQSAADLAPIASASTGIASTEPTFVVQPYAEPMPVPEALAVVPAEQTAIPAQLATVTAAPAAAQIPAEASEAPVQTVLETAPDSETTASAVATSAGTVLDELRSSPLANSADPAQSEKVAATATNIQLEITPTSMDVGIGIAPTAASTVSPRFTSQRNATAQKISPRGGHPLAGFMEAGAVAAPLSTYVSNQATVLAQVDTTGLDAAVEAAPEPLVVPQPLLEAVPDILPEPAPVAAPIVKIEPTVEAAPARIVPATLSENAGTPEDYNSVFVDPTDYSIGATEAPDVVISEQSTGCEFTVGQNQAVPNGACGSPSSPASIAGSPGAPTSAGSAAAASAPAWRDAPAAAIAPVANSPSVNVGPVSFSASGIQLSTSAAGRDYLNRSVRPLVNLQASERFIFPLAIPSPITSLFGFRIHPISGDHRFHAGTDIGAEQGTPVLAAQNGVVAAAESAGGYGLMVVLRHEMEDVQLESRYAHLAEMFVEAGEEVKKGDIIGLVGSTGNSTGPHLHFEMRQQTADGWVLVNADGLVQASLSNLVNALNNPLETLTFNLSDFNLSNLRARGSIKAPTTSIPTFPVGEGGIPFRPAQPNAS